MGPGLIPKAPGTWGSLWALGLWWFLLADLAWWQQLTITCAYFISGWVCSTRITRKYGINDAQEIVADEIAGMWLALLFVPQELGVAVAAFVLFRALDIVKPGPIGWLDKNVKGGFGVMIDDVLAGLLAGIAMYVITITL